MVVLALVGRVVMIVVVVVVVAGLAGTCNGLRGLDPILRLSMYLYCRGGRQTIRGYIYIYIYASVDDYASLRKVQCGNMYVLQELCSRGKSTDVGR